MKKSNLKYLSLYGSILAASTILFDVGFEQGDSLLKFINNLYVFLLILIIIGVPIKYVIKFPRKQKLRLYLIDSFYWIFLIVLLFSTDYSPLANPPFINLFAHKSWLFLAFLIGLVREVSDLDINLKYKKSNPALIFAGSFGVLIIAGTFLLLLPRATHNGINFSDALFTSTSAVCVTGLVVVDTGSYFTLFGQSIIMLLIQLGGIGIMTFTSFFGLFFRGGSSYSNLILLGSFTNVQKMADIWSTLRKILFFTFLIEAIGVALIYLNLGRYSNIDEDGKLFFAVFHSVSAFCNAGFSTLSDSFYDIQYRFNYPMHMVIALLFIVGGLGFPVVINFYTYVKHLVLDRLLRWNRKREVIYKAHVVNLNTRLVVYTTIVLIIVGTVTFFILEFNNTLAIHHGTGKLVTAFFGAVTPRTAGFNTIDTGSMHLSTLMVIIMLMWIGASPASTGGGIKTSTFALAVLNALSLAKGNNRLEMNRREIPGLSLRRAFAFMTLSLLVIGFVVFLLLFTEPDKAFSDIIFETFSAFSTVGLSRGITGELSLGGRYLIILTMFIGRIGLLTLLITLFRKTQRIVSQYPSEDILIN